jgi:hypothetical protein
VGLGSFGNPECTSRARAFCHMHTKQPKHGLMKGNGGGRLSQHIFARVWTFASSEVSTFGGERCNVYVLG